MSDAEAVKILRACKALVEKLNLQGIHVLLNPEEQAILQNFSDMLAIYGTMQQLKLLTDRAGIKIHELGTLRFRATIEYERKRGLANCPRCGCDKYEGTHHYLCQDSSGLIVFPAISDEDMLAVIEVVIAVENPSKASIVTKLLTTEIETSSKPVQEIAVAVQSEAPKKLLLKRLQPIQVAS